MSAEIKDLSPKHVWGYFYDLTQIPRPNRTYGGSNPFYDILW